MRRPSYNRPDRGRLDIKMTPMIDVVFQLLIFFVCTVSFQALEEALPTHLRGQGVGAVQLPPDEAIAELEDVVVRLTNSEGHTSWLLNGRVFDNLAGLRGTLVQLARLRRDLPVILDIAADVPLGDVIDVYDLCRLVGFEKIQFAAQADG